MIRPAARCRVLAAAAAVGLTATYPSAQQRPAPLRPEVRASRAVVAAGRTFTVEAGSRMLAAGANAVDAGVASVLAAAVVEISHFGLGGEAPIIIYSARDRRVVVINGQGSAPRAANPALFAGRSAVPGNGPLGATVPAVIDSVATALAQFGTRSFSDVVAPAIELADGFPMYEFLHRYLASERKRTEPYAWSMRTYYPEGRLTPTGEMFRQQNLASTLRALSAAERAALRAGASRIEGIQAARDAFYSGAIAQRMTAAVREAGGVMSDEDLASYRGKVEEPATVTYRGYAVYKAGFWNQGPALLQSLQLLEGFDLARMGEGSADAIHTIVEAVKLAFADRDRYYGDPDFVRVPGDALLSPPYAAARRALIDPARASLEQRPGNPEGMTEVRLKPDATEVGRKPHAPDDAQTTASRAEMREPPEPGDTTAIQVADAAGNLFSATPSSGWLLGGAFVAGETGVPMSNRMQAFRLDAASPNVLAGGKRPRTTLTPTIVLKDGRPFLAIGTPGGDSQDQQILLVLLNIIDFGMDVQAAIEAPRVNSLHPESSFDDHLAQPGVLEVEASVSADAVKELAARGHVVRMRPAYGISTGVVAAGVDPVSGRLRGGADPRRERALVAW